MKVVAELRDAGVGTLYWHAADARRSEAGWEFRPKLSMLPRPEGIEVVPVVRLEAGARGVTWFRLPEEDSVFGIGELSRIASGEVGEFQPTVSMDERGRLELRNLGRVGLPPRWAGREGETERGYQLEVEVEGGFRFASAGEFVRMMGHREADSAEPRWVTVGEAGRLTFWFSRLGVGDSLRSGVVESRDSKLSGMRWRCVARVSRLADRAIGVKPSRRICG